MGKNCLPLEQPENEIGGGGGEMDAVTLADLQHEPDRVGVLLEGADGTSLELDQLELDDSRIARTRLTGARLGHLRLSSSALDDCELSGAQMAEASFIRVHIMGSKLVGVDLAGATLTDVTFDSCILSSALFRMARLLRVRFVNCQLDASDFFASKMRDVEMVHCHLESTDFGQAQVESLDLRLSTIVSVRGVTGLAHATITEMQATSLGAQLAGAMGITVVESDVMLDATPQSVLIDEVSSDNENVEPSSSPDEALAHLAELRSRLTGRKY